MGMTTMSKRTQATYFGNIPGNSNAVGGFQASVHDVDVVGGRGADDIECRDGDLGYNSAKSLQCVEDRGPLSSTQVCYWEAF